jgi:phospho-2-dehydro-3-deoxyheptonate aldolase
VALKEVIVPIQVHDELPINEATAQTTLQARAEIHKILTGQDDRLLVVIGPCSIHDTIAAKDYARRLKVAKDDTRDDLLIVMRVYFEKPRTTVGWKGLINDPDLDSSFNINKGLRVAGQLLLDLNALGIPAAIEYLDLITPQYVSDLIAWGAIGARTTESQVHVNWLRDCHANSLKQCKRQLIVGEDVAGQIANGDHRIMGVMIESHLKAGSQKIVKGQALKLWTKYYRCLLELG